MDFLDIVQKFKSGTADFDLIHCPIHESHDLTCKLYEDRYYCYWCGATGAISSLKNRVHTAYKLKLDAFKPGVYEKPKFAITTKPVSKKVNEDER